MSSWRCYALFSLKTSESCLDSAFRIKLSSRLEWDAAICPPLAAIGRQLCEIRSPPVKGGPPNRVCAVHYVPKMRAMRSLYIIAHCFSQNLATGLQMASVLLGHRRLQTQLYTVWPLWVGYRFAAVWPQQKPTRRWIQWLPKFSGHCSKRPQRCANKWIQMVHHISSHCTTLSPPSIAGT